MVSYYSPRCTKLVRIGTLPLLICLLAAFAATSAHAEKFATYPPLPSGYSSIRVFDHQGRFVGRVLPEKRYWVSIDHIPVFLQNAVVAVEDSRFYEHNGVDFRGIARALVKDVVKGRLAEGGSTITQQLIKNKFLSSEKTLDRKLQEGRMAMEFERQYSKKQILEMYFNEIYYGNGAWGIAQAARLYFDKRPDELTDGECAMLAGVQKSPGRLNPLGETAKVMGRRDAVLKRMVDLKMISAGQEAQLRAHPPTVLRPGQAPSYVEHIRNKLVERYGSGVIEQGGLDVIAALDLKLQTLAEKVVREGAKKFSPQMQGALICLDPATGDVLAAVGGVDSSKGGYNRAFYAKRQPGSSIKPLIYSAAVDKGITASSIWSDAPVSYGGWTPQNYEGHPFGNLTLREALAHSNNVIAVKILENVGVPGFVEFARKLGLSLRSPNDLSLALGTDEVTLSDLVEAYAPFANGGLRPEARTIIRILDRRRNSWTENQPVVTQALPPATAYVVTQMLRDVLVYGTAKGLKKFSLERPAAGKTGTTSDYRDAWFIGYTPQLITGVWLGYDKPRPGGKGFTGGGAAAPIWGRFMKTALASKPAVDFPKPDTVVAVSIDPSTGYLAAPDCPGKKEEYYVAGTEPAQYCPKHGGELLPPPPPRVPGPVPAPEAVPGVAPGPTPAPLPDGAGSLPDDAPAATPDGGDVGPEAPLL